MLLRLPPLPDASPLQTLQCAVASTAQVAPSITSHDSNLSRCSSKRQLHVVADERNVSQDLSALCLHLPNCLQAYALGFGGFGLPKHPSSFLPGVCWDSLT